MKILFHTQDNTEEARAILHDLSGSVLLELISKKDPNKRTNLVFHSKEELKHFAKNLLKATETIHIPIIN